jgi:hypothetical protein
MTSSHYTCRKIPSHVLDWQQNAPQTWSGCSSKENSSLWQVLDSNSPFYRQSNEGHSFTASVDSDDSFENALHVKTYQTAHNGQHNICTKN